MAGPLSELAPIFQCPFFQGLSLSVCLASRRLIDSIKHTIKLNRLVPKYEFWKKSVRSTDTTPTPAKNFPQLSPTSIGLMMTPEATVAIVAIFMSVLLGAIAFRQAEPLSRTRRWERPDDGLHGRLLPILRKRPAMPQRRRALDGRSEPLIHINSLSVPLSFLVSGGRRVENYLRRGPIIHRSLQNGLPDDFAHSHEAVHLVARMSR